MRDDLKTGLNFGIVSGTITTLWLMMGLTISSESVWVVIGGILTIAIADAISDAMGIHISEEAKTDNHKAVWFATLFTFLFKFFSALTFLIPVIFFPLNTALLISIAWGLFLLSFLSWKIAKDKWESVWHVIFEHIWIACLVLILTYFVGKVVAHYFWV